jgi:hypothetical protein
LYNNNVSARKIKQNKSRSNNIQKEVSCEKSRFFTRKFVPAAQSLQVLRKGMGIYMLKKSINLLKRNPSIIILYVGYLVVMFLIVFALYPRDMSQFYNTNPTNFDFIAYGITMMKLLTALALISILGLLFFAGYGNMITEAVVQGKTSINSFLPGLKKYFVRVLLAMLLLIAFSVGISVVLSIMIVPVTLIMMVHGAESIYSVSIITTSITTALVCVTSPFIILWFPSIFIDDIGVIQGLKNGAKAGVKNYWKLLLVILLLCIPTFTNVMINFNKVSRGIIFTPSYYIILILLSMISIVILPAIFILYNDNVNKFNNNNWNNYGDGNNI